MSMAFEAFRDWNDTELERLAKLAEATADTESVGDYEWTGEISYRDEVSNWNEVVRVVLREVGRDDIADQMTVWESDVGKTYAREAGIRL